MKPARRSATLSSPTLPSLAASAGLCCLLGLAVACSSGPGSEPRPTPTVPDSATPSAEPASSSSSVPAPVYSSSAAPAGAVLAAWSQIVGDGGQGSPQIVARIVVQGAGADCGDFLVVTAPDGAPQPGLTARTNPDTSAFPVTVCQGALDSQVEAWLLTDSSEQAILLWQLSDGGGASSGPKANGQGPAFIGASGNALVLASIGDTGCRGDSDQPDCTLGSSDWPYQQIAEDVAGADPDFLIHVGDYRYFFETTTPDTWDYWLTELFLPARDLLLAVPQVLVRGNHEQCPVDGSIWYGEGYLYLLEPNTSDTTSLCGQNGDQLDPWYFDVTDPASSSSFRFVVLDTAVGSLPQADAQTALGFSAGQNSWWTAHHPFLGLYFSGSSAVFPESSLQSSLDSALQATGTSLCTSGNCSPATFLSGHIHTYQKTHFYASGQTTGAWTAPRQVIVGNSGVDLRGSLSPVPCTVTGMPAPFDTSEGVVDEVDQFGYILWTRSTTDTSGWSENAVFLSGGDSSNGSGSLPTCSG